jgi:hypothetical protein
MIAIVKSKPDGDPHATYVTVMWLMFLRAPSRKTLPRECVDLGEIGSVREVKINRMTPYSVVERHE